VASVKFSAFGGPTVARGFSTGPETLFCPIKAGKRAYRKLAGANHFGGEVWALSARRYAGAVRLTIRRIAQSGDPIVDPSPNTRGNRTVDTMHVARKITVTVMPRRLGDRHRARRRPRGWPGGIDVASGRRDDGAPGRRERLIIGGNRSLAPTGETIAFFYPYSVYLDPQIREAVPGRRSMPFRCCAGV
jgi:hypothetical protein